MSGQELRAVSRTIVDIDAELQMRSHAPKRGTIHDLSSKGAFFIADEPVTANVGEQGTLRFALPTFAGWLEPRIQLCRSTSFPRVGGQEVQALGMSFSGLPPAEERAITLACDEWEEHRRQEYRLAGQCFVQSNAGNQPFSRFGQCVTGGRDSITIKFAAAVPLASRESVTLKLGRVSVQGTVWQISQTPLGPELKVHLTGWGCDFFLHEARRTTMGGG